MNWRWLSVEYIIWDKVSHLLCKQERS